MVWGFLMKYFLLFMFISLLPTYAMSASEYKIEASYDDQIFIINSKMFRALSSCPGWKKGHKVIFLEGDPLGNCDLATLYNFNREKICNVRCK